MDPRTALRELHEELYSVPRDRDRIIDLLNGLAAWVGKGGWLPATDEIHVDEKRAWEETGRKRAQ